MMSVLSLVPGGAGIAGPPMDQESSDAMATIRDDAVPALKGLLGVAMLSHPTTLSGLTLMALRSVLLARRPSLLERPQQGTKPTASVGGALPAVA